MNKLLKKYKNISTEAKAAIAFFLASVVTKGITYLTTPLYIRFLTIEEYGKTALFLTWLDIFGIISMFCLANAVFNNGMVDYPKKRDEYSLSILGLSNIITLFFTIIIICIFPYIKKFIGLDFPFIILMCIVYFVQPAYNFWITRQRYEYNYKPVVFWTIIMAFFSPLVALALIYFNQSGDRLYLRIFGAEMTLVFFYLIFYIRIMIKGKFKIDKKYWKSAFLFNLPLIPHYLSIYLLNSIDKIMISWLQSDSATAFYSLAYTVASIALIVWTAINSSLLPFTYEKCKTNDYKSINDVTLPILTIFALCSLGVIMFAPEIIYMLSNNSYTNAIYVIPPIVGGVFFQVQYYIYANIVYYYKKPKYVMIGSFTASLLNIILNYFLIKKYGYVAAGYTTLICYIIQAFIDYIGMKKAVGKSVYNTKYLLFLSIVVIIISLLSIITYTYPILRYTIVLLLIIICIIKRKNLKNIMSLVSSRGK